MINQQMAYRVYTTSENREREREREREFGGKDEDRGDILETGLEEWSSRVKARTAYRFSDAEDPRLTVRSNFKVMSNLTPTKYFIEKHFNVVLHRAKF